MTSTTNLSTFKPTYLYIKQHTLTGKLYFGKTSKDLNYLINEYLGSGKHWQRHIKIHGTQHVITLWYELFTDKNSLIEFALKFSKEMQIVESSSWLNLVDENGLDGCWAGNTPWNKGLTKESNKSISNQSKKQSLSKKGLPAHNKGKSSPNKGRKLPPRTIEHKLKISASVKLSHQQKSF